MSASASAAQVERHDKSLATLHKRLPEPALHKRWWAVAA